MDMCTASVVGGTRWKPSLGAFALCQGRTRKQTFFSLFSKFPFLTILKI